MKSQASTDIGMAVTISRALFVPLMTFDRHIFTKCLFNAMHCAGLLGCCAIPWEPLPGAMQLNSPRLVLTVSMRSLNIYQYKAELAGKRYKLPEEKQREKGSQEGEEDRKKEVQSLVEGAGRRQVLWQRPRNKGTEQGSSSKEPRRTHTHGHASHASSHRPQCLSSLTITQDSKRLKLNCFFLMHSC